MLTRIVKIKICCIYALYAIYCNKYTLQLYCLYKKYLVLKHIKIKGFFGGKMLLVIEFISLFKRPEKNLEHEIQIYFI